MNSAEVRKLLESRALLPLWPEVGKDILGAVAGRDLRRRPARRHQDGSPRPLEARA